MTDIETPLDKGEAPKKKGLPIGALVGALVPVVSGLGGAALAFFLTPAPNCPAAEAGHGAAEAHPEGPQSALYAGEKAPAAHKHAEKKGEPSFVPVEPLVVTLGPDADAKYLKITLSIETEKGHEKDVVEVMPRIRDVLNVYLRAIDEADLAEPSNMARIRSQMLRRVQLVAPDADITNILITDFVLT